MAIIPTKFFFTKGKGIHQKDMRAFEEALREAGVYTCNFAKTSSAIPPGCRLISKEGIKLLHPGQITFAIMAQSQTVSRADHQRPRLISSFHKKPRRGGAA